MVATAEEFLARNPALLDEDRTDPRVVRLITRVAWLLEVYFRFRLRGLERVPEGPCIVLANHSCGAVQEIVLLLRAWVRRFGDRPARGLAHRVSWHYPFKIVPVIQKVGAIFAHPEVARRALERGCALLVFPGGDVEACRPFSDRYRVTFAGRTGFARLARQTNVPVVPIVLCGAHATFLMTPFGVWMARRLGWAAGLRAFPLTWGMILFAAAAIATVIFPSLWPLAALAFLQGPVPLPTRIEAATLPPMRPREDEDDATFAARVESEMQQAMDQLARGRTTPWS